MTQIRETKKNNQSVFNSRRLLRAVYDLFENYSYKLAARRFVLELFSTTAKTKAMVPPGEGSLVRGKSENM